jgi:acetate kinase
MDDYLLVLNAGSSSLKFCVYHKHDTEQWRLESRGQIEGIGTAPKLSVKNSQGEKIANEKLPDSIKDGRDAIDSLGSWLLSKYGNARLLGVGHRVVHGGASYTKPIIVTKEILDDLRGLIPLAPLHQPYNLAAIEALHERRADVPQVACFDTSFHRGHSAVAELVPLPANLRKEGLQRYGFHGLSYEYIASVLPQAAPEIAKARVIVAHLGSGASLCAMKNGKSIDTTMSFTAVDGICMGTRPGAIDPGVVLYLFQQLKMSVKEVEDVLYKKSGLLGISGISNDMRDLLGSNDPNARLAVDYFIYRIAKEIGALSSVLAGIDGLVFTAGIGENSAEIRRRICESCEWLGVEIDLKANSSSDARISTSSSKVSAWVIPTNEELMIARHTGKLLGLTL